MKANLSLYNAIFNVWMVAVHPSRHISVASVGWWTSSCHLPSCFALKTIPFRCEVVVTFFVVCFCIVHVSIPCIKSDVACTFRNNCRRKTQDFLRFILADTKNMNESFHSKKCGQRQDLHFNLTCRLPRKPIPVASISLLFICTDCQRDFMRTISFPCFKWKQSQFRGITQKRQLCFWHFILRANSHSWVGIYRLNHNKFVFNWSMFPNGTLHFKWKQSQFRGITEKAALSGFIVWTITSLSMFPTGTLLPSFSVENAIILSTNLNGTHKKLNQPKMVVSNWMRPHRVVWSVSDRASVCRRTYFASSANEFPWALTLECPKDINTCAAILAWIVFSARTFVNVWKKQHNNNDITIKVETLPLYIYI